MNPSSVSRGRYAFDGESNRAAEVGLLEKIRAGDVAAFAEWLERSWRPLVLYCARILGNRDGAEDVAQEAFIRIWERRCHWRPQSSLRAILYTIARNLSLNQRSSTLARARRLVARQLGTMRSGSLQERVEAADFERALRHAISLLPPRQKEILTLSRVDGLSRAEIAQVTGLSPQTVANHLATALANLRRQLEPFFRER